MQRLEKGFQLAFKAVSVIEALTTNQSRLFLSLIYYFLLTQRPWTKSQQFIISLPINELENGHLTSIGHQFCKKPPQIFQFRSQVSSQFYLISPYNEPKSISRLRFEQKNPFRSINTKPNIFAINYIKNLQNKEMKISYGFVFYFEIFMIILTISLILLYFKPIRTLIFSIADKYKIGEGPIYNTIFWIIFAVIAIILIDSVLTYWAIRQTLEIDAKDMLVDNFDTIKANQHDDYIIIYKKLREYYMAERNFMLTSSTLFVMFVFRNFLSGFRKIYDNETADLKVKAN